MREFNDIHDEVYRLELQIMKKDKKIVQHSLKDHVASCIDLGIVQIIDLKRPGHVHEESIRYLFDNEECRLTISGDYGNVIVWNGYGHSNINVNDIHCYFDYPDYFVEKIRANEEGKLYRYEEELAKLQLDEALFYVDDSDLINAAYLDGNKETFINDLMYEFTCYDGFQHIGSSIYSDVLDRLDEGLISEMIDMGKVFSRRIYFYLEGLKIAMKQLHIGIYSEYQ